jgi:antitoxin (DNA-binding transcriptional repressor) of toxin-antitoxin stability system
MKTVTTLEFRKDAERILRRVAKGERFLLSHRGRAAARLEPLNVPDSPNSDSDPFLTIGQRALPSPKGKPATPTYTALSRVANDVFAHGLIATQFNIL